MMDWQDVPIDFGQGLDTKTDPKLVIPGKLLLLQNAVFTKAKRLIKRNGYDSVTLNIVGGGTLSAPQMVKSYKNELLSADSGKLYSWSPTLSGWVNKGPYESVELSESFIWKETSIDGCVDCAVLNGIAIYGWSTKIGGTTTAYAAVVDLSTGDFLLNPSSVSSYASTAALSAFVRCVALGSTSLAVTYLNSSGNLVMRILTAAVGGVSLGSELTITTVAYHTGDTTYCYDIVSIPTGAAVAFTFFAAGSYTLDTATISTTGTVSNLVLIKSGSFIPGTVFLSVDSSTNHAWVYFFDSSIPATENLYYSIVDNAGGLLVGATVVLTTANIHEISAQVLSSSTQRIFYSIHTIDSNTSSATDETLFVDVQSNGTFGSPSGFLTGVFPASRPFTVSGNNYMFVSYRGMTSIQQTFFLVNLTSRAVVARFLWGNGANQSSPSSRLQYLPYVPNASLNGSSKVIFPCAAKFQTIVGSSSFTPVSALIGAASIQIDFASLNLNRALNSGGVVALNGGLVSMYDGKTCAELGFHLAPEIAITAFATGGSIGPGVYDYIAIFQWTDNQGNLHESAPSIAVATPTLSGGSNSVEISVTCPYLTQKSNVNAAIYRTTSGGTTYHLVTDPIAVKIASPNSFFVDFTDTSADASIIGNLNPYTNGGVVNNSPPPPAIAMESHNNRAWMVSSEDQSVWYSKSFGPGIGMSLSQSLILILDPKLGNPVALSEMDEKMIVFKQYGNLWFSGDGADDTGANSSLTVPQFLPSDTGCNSLKSVILTPRGILRKTAKGFYLMDRAMNDHYYDQFFDGAAVQAFNSQNVLSATLVEGVNQIRFLTNSGSTLVYDYVMNQWGVFTNHLGLSADIWNGLYVYARTDGKIYQENTTTFLDNTTDFQIGAQLSWLALARVQGFQRVRRVLLLGDYTNGTSASHGVKISAGYDFSPTLQNPVPYLFGAASGSGVFQYRERLARQKCDSLTLLIQEITTGASGEFIDLTNLSLEVGIKRGSNRLPGTASVG